MKITLNEDRASMCGIGKRVFLTFENPGPVELDPKSLSREELIQLVAMIRSERLRVEGLAELNAVLEGIQKSTPQKAAVQQAPVVVKEVTIEEIQEHETVELKRLLESSVATVKKEIATMPPSKLRKVKKLEEEGKNRATILALTKELIAKHEKAVQVKVGTEDIGAATEASKVEIGKGMHGVILDNISDVVESDVTPVTLK